MTLAELVENRKNLRVETEVDIKKEREVWIDSALDTYEAFTKHVKSVAENAGIFQRENKTKIKLKLSLDEGKTIEEREVKNIKLELDGTFVSFSLNPWLGYLGALGKIDIETNSMDLTNRFDFKKEAFFFKSDGKITYLDDRYAVRELDGGELEKFLIAVFVPTEITRRAS